MALIAGATYAFFTDSETSTGNTFTAGRLDLKVNEQDDPVGLVTIEDFKPGDDRFVDKRLSVDFNPAKVWVHLRDLSDSQGTQTEPETLEENGQPQSNLQDVVTYDLTVQTDPANPVITFADNVTMTQAHSCWIPLGVIPGNNVTTVVRQSFHFPANVTNWAQGDLLNFTEEFYATQVNNPGGPPPTAEGRVWNDQTNRCEDQVLVACTENDAIYASSAPFEDQGLRKDGGAILANRSVASAAFGIPQTTGTDSDVGFPAGSFYSLGFPTTVPVRTASIVLGFAEPFYDGPVPGPDLQIFEVTGGIYPDEAVKVEIGPTSTGPWTQVASTAVRDELIDIAPNSSAQYVKLTDVSDKNLFANDADGYDLDAVKALCTASPVVQ